MPTPPHRPGSLTQLQLHLPQHFTTSQQSRRPSRGAAGWDGAGAKGLCPIHRPAPNPGKARGCPSPALPGERPSAGRSHRGSAQGPSDLLTRWARLGQYIIFTVTILPSKRPARLPRGLWGQGSGALPRRSRHELPWGAPAACARGSADSAGYGMLLQKMCWQLKVRIHRN